MPAIELDALTWPEVEAELRGGRDTVVIAFGATEQHGRHMPLATDALLGDHLARELAERLDAFIAPTLRVGCSKHHLSFPGTLSLTEETFAAVVRDLVASLAGAGFRRIVLVPTHGGNYQPLAAAVESLPGEQAGLVAAITDLGLLFRVAELGEREHGVPIPEGGLHAGEWETSMLMASHPGSVRSDRAEAGFVGDLEEAMRRMFEGGTAAVAENGVVGDPTSASAENGRRYWDAAIELALEAIEAQSGK